MEPSFSWPLRVIILVGTVAVVVTHPNPSPDLPEKSSRTEDSSQNTRAGQGAWVWDSRVP